MTLSTPDIERLKGLLEKALEPLFALQPSRLFLTSGEQAVMWTAVRQAQERAINALPALLSDRADLEERLALAESRIKQFQLEDGFGISGLSIDSSYVEGNREALKKVQGWHHDATARLPSCISRLHTAEARVADLEAEVERLRDGLSYLLKVREIKCEHAHAGPDPFCANCIALALLHEGEK